MPLGTNVYSLGLNLAASEHQTALINAIKSSGGDVIQTSSGLCAKSPLSPPEFEKFVQETAGDGIKIEALTASTDRDSLSPDVKAFLGA